ncbi:DUF4350 domain-containing protein [Methylobacterium nonmethylotrophicum]|uniref:DUF4350 domain-containing protein n=1 Tax=Methylobacterium nonmethylotrophicum TaxID=1141884 RepID=A0A4Z0NGM9_9HYPH|nr:DUF4350 domain-containing protein [Methylobacterium nonmethylotrophicum]TGD95127.1 hypothetical protein EU555_29570 [Methylobacterium nonmethylotrophicum]
MIRSRRFALGLVVLACGWQMALGEVTPAAAPAGGALVLAGAAAAGTAVPGWPARAGLMLGLLAVSALGAETAAWLMAVVKAVPGAAPALAAALGALGVPASAVDGRVVIHASNQVLEWFPGTARLSGFVVLTLGASMLGAALLLPLRRRGRTLALWLASLLAYAAVRAVVVGAARPELPLHGLETSPAWTLLTWLPFALAAPRLALSEPGPPPARPSLLRPVAACALGAFWVVGLGWEDPGTAKAGRVLIDDSHGIWEPTTLPFDTRDFSRRTAYSYSDLFGLIGRHFRVERWSRGPLTAKALAGADVLIVKTPTARFEPDEVAAIEAWVAGGGGLFLIGDHTDLFGMSTYMNELSRRFGIGFRNDDTYDLATEGTSGWRAPRWLPHPVAARTGAFQFETSCTLAVPLSARIPVRGYALGTDRADFSNPGFFGNIQLDASDDYGFFPQLATLGHGRGRVAAVADSTPFSNFSVYFPGRPDMVLATLAFLNRTATGWRSLPLLAGTGLVFCVVLLLNAPAPPSRWVSVEAAALGLGVLGASLAVSAVNGGLAIPPPHGAVRTVAIDRAVSGGQYPEGLYTDPRYDLTGFDSFVVAIQRLAYVPVLGTDLREAMRGSAALVLLHPRRALTVPERDQLLRFVSAGGGLLVVDGLIEPGQATNEILQPFGLSVGTETIPLDVEEVVPVAGAPKRRTLRPVLAASGGFPVLLDPDGRTIYAEQEVGAGRVGVLVDSAGLARAALGNRFYATIGEEQKQSYETLFFILRRIVEERPKT